MPSTEITLREGNLISKANDFIQQKEAEIADGERALEALIALSKERNINSARIARVKGRIRFLKKFVNLMKEGFIPIPRMNFTPINQHRWEEKEDGSFTSIPELVLDRLPVEAIMAINEYKDKFQHFGVVQPQTEGRKRDPFLIGIIRYRTYEEHFLIGWWRPDIMKPTELW